MDDIDFSICNDQALALLEKHAREDSVRAEAKAERERRAIEAAKEALLLDIARRHCAGGLTTLQARNSDSLDFLQVSVWGLRGALLEAFEAGKEEGR